MKKLKIAVFAKHTSDEAKEYVRNLYETYLSKLTDFHRVDIDPALGTYDIVIVFGGDGTVLHAANFIHQDSVIIGFNMGTLGFLTPWDKKDAISVISKYLECSQTISPEASSVNLIEQNFKVQKSNSIEGYLSLSDGNCYRLPRAINEYIIRHEHPNKMVHLGCIISNKTATEYHADALIVSTALGSTAYSLAAGGSILEPSLNSFSLVPVAPHALTHRPLVISADNVIRLSAEQNSGISISVDGKLLEDLPEEFYYGDSEGKITITLQNALFPITMIQPTEFNMYTVLNEKFRWGQRG